MTRRSLRAGIVLATVLLALAPVRALAASQAFSGTVSVSGTSFRSHTFDVATTGTISATLDWNDAGAALNLLLYDPSGTMVKKASGSKPESLSYQATVTGTWKLGVKAVVGSANYSMSVTYPNPPLGTPVYVRTIGGGTSGHADMYPSGVDVDANGNVYVADTGDDQILSFAANGSHRWTTGTRGNKAPGRFENPRDVAFLNGKVYVADTGYNRVQVLNASDGSVSSVWSTRFGTIMGIGSGVDGNGNPVVLVAESSANTIRVFTPAGALIRSVGSGPGSGAGQLNGSRDATTDADGNVYVADYANSRVAKFSPSGSWLMAWGVNGTGPGELKRPYGIAADDAGNVYVADSNDYIHKFTNTGTFIRTYGTPGEGAGRFSMLRRVAVGAGATPNVYGADLWNYKIEVFGQGAANIDTLGGTPPADGFFNTPYGIAVDGGDTFVTDMVNQRVQRFSSDQPYAWVLKWGKRGWGEGNPGFNWPKGLAIGSNGGSRSVWVADTRNNRVQEFFADGTPTGRVFGNVGAAIGQLKWPFDVATTSTGNVLVADTNNGRVELWNPSGPGVVWASTGPGAVPFSKPKAVDVAAGKVYVADTQNHRVVVLDASDGGVLDSYGKDDLTSADGVAVDPSGDVWVSDSLKNRVVEFSSNGSLIQRFGSSSAQFNKPYHLDVLSDGTGVFLFVADAWNDRIQVFQIG